MSDTLHDVIDGVDPARLPDIIARAYENFSPEGKEIAMRIVVARLEAYQARLNGAEAAKGGSHE